MFWWRVTMDVAAAGGALTIVFDRGPGDHQTRFVRGSLAPMLAWRRRHG
jgi:hypothetical protein